MKKQIIILIVFLLLMFVAAANDYLVNQLAEILQVKPHHAANKIKTGIWLIFFTVLLLWGVILFIRSLKHLKR